MSNKKHELDRREFTKTSLTVGTAVSLGTSANVFSADQTDKKTRVGVIGCGSVSRKYLPHLKSCPFVELVSTCDIIMDA